MLEWFRYLDIKAERYSKLIRLYPSYSAKSLSNGLRKEELILIQQANDCSLFVGSLSTAQEAYAGLLFTRHIS